MNELERKKTDDSVRADEVDLLRLFSVLKGGKWWIFGVSILFGVCGALYSLSLPNLYKSEGVYAIARNQSGPELGGTLGGLASLAGVNVGQAGGSDVDQAMVLVTSWPFLEHVINKNHLKPLIVAVKGWDRHSKELVWDDRVYSAANKRWLPKRSESEQTAEPTSYQAFKAIREMVNAAYDAKSGMVTLSVEHYSPEIAKEWVEIIVSELNAHFQKRDTENAKSSIQYLQAKIDETSYSEMRSIFYGMIEAQTRTLMLAEVDESYFFVDVVEPKVAELKSSPKRVLIVFLFTFLGGTLSVISVLVHGTFKNSQAGTMS